MKTNRRPVGRPSTGYLYRRARLRPGLWRELNIDDPAGAEAVIYWAVRRDGIRRKFCLFTTSKAIAEQLVSADRAALHAKDYISYLRKIIARGQSARRELDSFLSSLAGP